jgi:branched-chain amino acid transport system substrate-binding protein
MPISHQRPTDAPEESTFPATWARGLEPSRALLAPSPIEGINIEDGSDDARDSERNEEIRSLPDLQSKARFGRMWGVLAAVTALGLVSATAALLLVANFLPKRMAALSGAVAESNSAMTQPFGTIATTRQFAQNPPQVASNSSPLPEPAVQTPPPVKVAVAAPVAAPAEPASIPVRGVTDKEILFGMSAPFSGSARELGRQMKLGIETAFNLANDAGGVHGRQLRLVTADDGYEPARTAEAMKQLFEKDQVFGIIGNVGTPTAMVALPYALEHKMLFFGAFTGAGLLRRDPPDRYVFNYRASYAEETDAVVRYLVQVRKLRPDQIAVFAQQDSYGDAGFAGVAKAIRALRSGDEGSILRLNYKRNTVDVDDAVAHLRAHRGPKAVVMVATYRAAAKFIEKTRDLYPTMIYTNVSFVGSTALADELMLLGPHYAEGVIVTQVVPAIDSYSTKVLEYKSALAKYFPGETPDYVSLEGYISADLLIEALKRSASQIDTEKLVNELEGLHAFDMGLGTPLNFGLTEHQGSHKVWGTQLDANGHYQAIDLQ